MSTKYTRSKPKNFTTTLEEALRKYTEPKWLGENSPLAFPYLLQSHSTNGSSSPSERGRALQQLIGDAASEIGGKNSERYQTVLREYYFAGRTVVAACDKIGLSKNPFHVSRRGAIAAIEQPIIQRLHPALRLEAPNGAERFVGRTKLLAECTELLQGQRSVGLLGGSGSGKSALLAALARSWDHPAFWFTVRPGLNDAPQNLLFALALFMHQCGQSTLWQELIATKGQLEVDTALHILRYMLAESGTTPLICIDNCDVLEPASNPVHQSLCELLDSLSSTSALCCAGRNVPLMLDEYVELTALDEQESVQFLRDLYAQDSFTDCSGNDSELDTEALKALHAYSAGNPRLLILCHSLLEECTSLDEVMSLLSERPTITQLLEQLLSRLTQAEVDALCSLSVYRSPAPLHLWAQLCDISTIERLQSYQLIQTDSRGGVEIVPIFRAHLYAQLAAEERQSYHLAAAEVRMTIAMHTSALYHFIHAQHIEDGLWIWRENQQHEIDQGQAAAALNLLMAIEADSFSVQKMAPEAQDLLRLLGSELHYFVGNLPQATNMLQQISPKTDATSVAATRLAGVIANDRSEFTSAESYFQSALQTASKLVGTELASIHKGLGWMHWRQRELDKAERSLDAAHFEIENMRGNIASMRCQFTEAAAHYSAALTQAMDGELKESEAKVRNNLAIIHIQNGEYAQADEHLTAASSIYGELGNLPYEIGCKITTAVAYNLAQRFDHAEAMLNEIELLFGSMLEVPSWLRSLYQQALAETMLGMNRLDEAQAQIDLVIGAEEVDLLCDAYRTQGEILTKRRDYDAAEQSFRYAIEMAERTEDSYLGGYAWRALANLYTITKRAEEAQAAREKARQLFLEMNLIHEADRTVAPS